MRRVFAAPWPSLGAWRVGRDDRASHLQRSRSGVGCALKMSATLLPPLPEGVREGDERLICLTEAAGAKVRQLAARPDGGPFLRIKVTGGGCNGLSYKMLFIAEPKRGDIIVRSQAAAVAIDSKSALYLRGMQLDFSDRLVAGGFKFSNPNAKASCSCGESFSV